MWGIIPLSERGLVDAGLSEKRGRLLEVLGTLDTAAVALSSGVDSTLLLACSVEALGTGNVLALTARSPSVPPAAVTEASDFCHGRGIEHLVVDTREFELPGFDRNPPNRCYLCKREMISAFQKVARSRGIEVVLEGSNADDALTERPGAAAVRELGARSPLMEAGLAKADVRSLAREMGLVVWDKPNAACLCSRFEVGALLEPEALARVDAAEDALRGLGFRQVRVRVRDGGDTARIEVGEDEVARLGDAGTAGEARRAVGALGFGRVEIDERGYRGGR